MGKKIEDCINRITQIKIEAEKKDLNGRASAGQSGLIQGLKTALNILMNNR